MATTSIEWSEHVWNPVTGCTRVSAGCDNCYAVPMTRRLAGYGNEKYTGLVNDGKKHFNGTVKLHPDALDIPLRRKKPTRYFVNSMSDLFHPAVPFDFIDRVYAVMADAQQHTFQVLTKRPERMAEYLNDPSLRGRLEQLIRASGAAEYGSHFGWEDFRLNCWPLANVWAGTSVENQEAADERIPNLLRCPAAVRWLSCEPLIGPVDLAPMFVECPTCGGSGSVAVSYGGKPCPECLEPYQGVRAALHWIVVGGESGPGARPFNIEWARSIISQCRDAGVACFVKQIGKFPYCNDTRLDVNAGWRVPSSDSKGGLIDEWPYDIRVREYPEAVPA